MWKVKLLIVDSQVVICKGIQILLQNTPNVKVVGEAHDNHEAMKKIRQLQPDVALINCKLPPTGCRQTTRDVKLLFPHVKILLFAIYNAFEPHITQALRAGASGYVTRLSTADDLVSAISTVLAGKTYLDGVVSPPLRHEEGDEALNHRELTDREREVLRLLAQGKSICQSAETLNISKKTVENHRANLSKKLNLHSIAELTHYAILHGVIFI